MPLHRDRRATPQSVKSGPPLRGRPEKPAGVRRKDCTGNHPALHLDPTRRLFPGDHGVQTWSSKGLRWPGYISKSS